MANEALTVFIPKEAVNDLTVRLSAWRAADREQVEAGRVIAEIETSKAVLELRAPAAGFLRRSLKEGCDVPVGGPLCFITQGAEDPVPELETEAAAPAEGGLVARLSRKAAELVKQHGIALERFAGKGLIREADVLALLGQPVHGPDMAAGVAAKAVTFKREALPKAKVAEARYLLSGSNALASSVSVACPTRGLRAAAARHPEWGASPAAAIVSEAARLLRKHPVFNAFYEDGAVNYYDEVNVGFAVDAGEGLKVPVIRDADKKDLGAIAREIQDILLAYTNGEITLEAASGGTFTVTDLSGEGVLSFQPLINHRQSAILGVGAEFRAPGSSEGFYQLILAFDHRLTEGRAAAQFLKDLRDKLSAYEAG
ncbi:MAG: 2-oxo acid dehydrogenase subunit E2 [Elusimicrobia bacterium]|nr:2-oxo acid dehydrogenase subunit E2 [Elusimicrobiota bacterium]